MPSFHIYLSTGILPWPSPVKRLDYSYNANMQSHSFVKCFFPLAAEDVGTISCQCPYLRWQHLLRR